MPGPEFSVMDIIGACSGRLLQGTANTRVSGVSTDTRTIKRGQAFFALAGPNHDAHDFIPAAAAAGSHVIVAHKEMHGSAIPPQTAFILVEDTTEALMRLASWHRGRLSGKVIGITGSCGKSTVKAMTGAVLSGASRCTVARRSFNNRIGVSLTLLEARLQDDYVVLELGANHAGEIDELARLARPDAACITCIGECHLEGFGGIEGVREAKAEIITHIARSGLLVLNADDEMCVGLRSRFSGKILTFGFSESADIRPVDIRNGCRGVLFRAAGHVFHLPVPGRHNVMNACAALCMAGWAGVSGNLMIQALAAAELPGLRCERRRIGGVVYILDCYNSNPTAMRAACEVLGSEQTSGRRVMVCGDMLELGEWAKEKHEAAGRLIAESGVDLLVAVGNYAGHIVKGWQERASHPHNALVLPDSDDAWLFIHHLTRPGDTVMVKGSRKLRLEEVVDCIGEYAGGQEREVA